MQLESRAKSLHTKKDQLELTVESLKRDAEELREQVNKEEKRLEKEGAAGFARDSQKIGQLTAERDKLRTTLRQYEEERVKANEELDLLTRKEKSIRDKID